MTNLAGVVTLGTAGNPITVTCGFQPNDVEFDVSAKLDQSGAIQTMHGYADAAGNQWVTDNTFDGTNRNSHNETSGRCIKVYEWNGTGYVVVLEAAFVSYVATGFKLNVITANTEYHVFFKARSV